MARVRRLLSLAGRVKAALRRGVAGPQADRGWDASIDPFIHHRHQAIAALSQGVAATYGYDIPGDIAEFGTMSGETAAGLARAIGGCDRFLGTAVRIAGLPLKQLHLFDSFAGLPAGENPVDAASPHVQRGVWSAGSLVGISAEQLAAKLKPLIAPERVHIYAGWFSETIPHIPPDTRFALVHVDSDLYASAMDVLSGLFERRMISHGALIYFDDWNCNVASNEFGERRAWRECVARYKIEHSDEGSYGIFARRFTVHSYSVPGDPS